MFSSLRRNSTRAKVHPGPFNGEVGFEKEEASESEEGGQDDGSSSSEVSSVDDAGRLFDYAVSMVAATTVALAPPRAAREKDTTEDEEKQDEEQGQEVRTEQKSEDGDEVEDGASDSESSASSDDAGRLFDYAVSMAAARTVAVAPPQGQISAERKQEEAWEGSYQPWEEEGRAGEDDHREESGEEGGEEEDSEEQEDQDALGALFDYAVSQAGLQRARDDIIDDGQEG